MPKKIIILNHGLHIAGVSRTLVNFANCLVEHGHDVTIKLEINDFTLQKELDPRVKCSLFLKERHLFGRRIKGFLRFYELYRKLLLKLPAKLQYKLTVPKNCDVEIAFNRGAAAKIISASTSKKAKKLAWVHSDYMRNDNPLAGFKTIEEAQKGYSAFDHVICVSEQAEKSFREKFGETGNLITRYNIMDVDRIRKAACEITVPKDRFTVVTVGRLCEAKNYFMLLDAAAELKRRGLDLSFWIVGGGSLQQPLEDYKNKLQLDNVIFWGSKENPYPYFAGADLYLSTSVYEGLSTTTIEAMILEKPSIATDCTGMREILGDSEYGVIVPIDTLAIADAVQKMAEDEAFRTHYKAMAKSRAIYFEPEKAYKNIEELL